MKMSSSSSPAVSHASSRTQTGRSPCRRLATCTLHLVSAPQSCGDEDATPSSHIVYLRVEVMSCSAVRLNELQQRHRGEKFDLCPHMLHGDLLKTPWRIKTCAWLLLSKRALSGLSSRPMTVVEASAKASSRGSAGCRAAPPAASGGCCLPTTAASSEGSTQSSSSRNTSTCAGPRGG